MLEGNIDDDVHLYLTWGGFPFIAETTAILLQKKSIIQVPCQYFNESFHCKNCLPVFSAITGKPV